MCTVQTRSVGLTEVTDSCIAVRWCMRSAMSSTRRCTICTPSSKWVTQIWLQSEYIEGIVHHQHRARAPCKAVHGKEWSPLTTTSHAFNGEMNILHSFIIYKLCSIFLFVLLMLTTPFPVFQNQRTSFCSWGIWVIQLNCCGRGCDTCPRCGKKALLPKYSFCLQSQRCCLNRNYDFAL